MSSSGIYSGEKDALRRVGKSSTKNDTVDSINSLNENAAPDFDKLKRTQYDETKEFILSLKFWNLS